MYDLAMHMVSEQRLGLPQTSREALDLLHTHSLIDEDIIKSLKAMEGCQNIAVHDYQTLDLGNLKQIIENHLSDFTDFTKQLLEN